MTADLIDSLEHLDVSDDSDGQVAHEAKTDAKKKKKKKSTCIAYLRLMTGKKKAVIQSSPPRVGLSKLYKTGIYPIGQEVDYVPSRMSNAEAKERERLAQGDPQDNYQNIRRAAEVHRQVRRYAREHIKPGMTMTEIAEMIEDGTRALVEENGLESGIGFPTGLSVNEVAAHYTPNAGDTKG